MKARRRKSRLAVVVPALTGLMLLETGLWLMPDRREIATATRRALPAAPTPSPTPTAAPRAPTLAAAVATADAAGLAALTARSIAEGRAVTTAQVAYDLVAAGRPMVALDYLAARPDGAAPATWALRIDLLRKAGRTAEAKALLAAAVRARSAIAPADIVAAGYALVRPDLIVAAATSGAIPPPDATLALDLARRFERARRPDLIATLDRTTRADWRAADPWLAIRVAAQRGDTAAGLRAADRLPADQRAAAREAILTRAGDRPGLRALLLAQAQVPDVETAPIAERLLATGYRDDAIAVLKRASAGQPADAPASRRLLYLMGPRPAADDLGWLRQRTMQGDADTRLEWLRRYAERDRPAAALAFLATHPFATRTDVLLMRLSLAEAAGDDAAAARLFATLLDGRALDSAQLRAVSSATRPHVDPADIAALARRRVAAGIAEPGDRMMLAWSAWNGGDADGAARWLRDHLATAPTDVAALRLMADVQTRLNGRAAARPWLDRALAQTPAGRPRAELLDRLDRRAEALALVERLHAATPRDRALAALHARLLIADGQPGRARRVLAP